MSESVSEPGAIATGLALSAYAHYEAAANNLRQKIVVMIQEIRNQFQNLSFCFRIFIRVSFMISTASDVLERFGHLPIAEKKKVVGVILRESIDIETPQLSDDDLVLNAEEIFQMLDEREAQDGKS